MGHLHRLAFVAALFLIGAHGHGYNRDVIPNGYFVPCPPGECVGFCAGVGHLNRDGSAGCEGGEHPTHDNNNFGLQLQDVSNFTWTREFCMMDSDGDGQSNGDELGDPCCIWRQGGPPPSRGRGRVSHPGAATSKAPFKSCRFDGAPALQLLSQSSTESSITAFLNTSDSCVCSMTWFIDGPVQVDSGVRFRIVNVNDTGNAFRLTALEPATVYSVRILLKNLAGNVTVNFTQSTQNVSSDAPSPPTSASLVSVTTTTLLVSWTGQSSPVGPIQGYEVDVRVGTGEMYTAYTGPTGYYQLTQVDPGTTCYFRVRAYNAAGIGLSSRLFNFTTATSAISASTNSGGSTTGNGGQTPVPIDPAGGFYAKMSFQRPPKAGEVVPMTFNLYEPNDAAIPWSNLVVSHDRKLHVVIVGSDLNVFGRIHPEDFSTTDPIIDFNVEFVFPTSGRYMIYLDFVVNSNSKRDVVGRQVTLGVPVVVQPSAGFGSLEPAPIWDNRMNKVFKGFLWQGVNKYVDAIVVNSTYITAGTPLGLNVSLAVNNGEVARVTDTCTKLVFSFRNSEDGTPTSNLTSYLTEPLLFVAVHQSLNRSVHTQGSVINDPKDAVVCNGAHVQPPATFGPFVAVGVNFPLVGAYQVFAAVNHNNARLFLPTFRVDVLPPIDAPLTPTPVQPGDYERSLSLLDGKYTLYWTVERQVQISIAIVAQTSGWVGIGFDPQDQGMKNCDMILGYASSGVTIRDSYSTSETSPSVDTFLGGKNSISEYAGVVQNGETTLKFRRLLDTSDEWDAVISDRLMGVVFAYAFEDHTDFGRNHGPNRGYRRINFFTGADGGGSNTDTLRLSHSVLMVLAWAVFSTIGILIARYGHAYTWWFPVHIILLSLAMLLSLLGFIIGIVATNNDFKQSDQVALTHSWLGLLVVISGLIQPVLGIIADRLYDPKRTHVPFWPDKIHWLVGRCALIGAIINIFVGMVFMQVKAVWWALFIVWMFVQAAAFTFLEYSRSHPSTPPTAPQEEEMTAPQRISIGSYTLSVSDNVQ